MYGERPCQPGNYSSKCIPNKEWCDGYPDCANGEDEEGCGKIFIESVPNKEWCDGYPDCANREDEEVCGKIFIESIPLV